MHSLYTFCVVVYIYFASSLANNICKTSYEAQRIVNSTTGRYKRSPELIVAGFDSYESVHNAHNIAIGNSISINISNVIVKINCKNQCDVSTIDAVTTLIDNLRVSPLNSNMVYGLCYIAIMLVNIHCR